MAIYMKFGKIDGDVTTKGYEKWINVHSFQWGAGRGISSAAGSGTNRQGSHASVSEVTISKSLDPSSLGLLRDSLDGKLNTKVEFKFTLADQSNQCYLAYELTDTGVSGYSVSSGGDRPSESISLNFAKIMATNTEYDSSGKAKPDKLSYDMTKHVAS